MQITFTIDTGAALTERDRDLIRAILAEDDTPDPAPVVAVPVGDRPAPKRRGRPKKADSPARDFADAPEPAAREPESEPAAGEPESEPESEPTAGEPVDIRLESVNRATELISAGRADEVRAALAVIGVKKVGEIPDDRVKEFVESLAAA